MHTYDPARKMYPGDTSGRAYTQNNKKRRSSIDKRFKSGLSKSGITMDHSYREAVESG